MDNDLKIAIFCRKWGRLWNLFCELCVSVDSVLHSMLNLFNPIPHWPDWTNVLSVRYFIHCSKDDIVQMLRWEGHVHRNTGIELKKEDKVRLEKPGSNSKKSRSFRKETSVVEITKKMQFLLMLWKSSELKWVLQSILHLKYFIKKRMFLNLIKYLKANLSYNYLWFYKQFTSNCKFASWDTIFFELYSLYCYFILFCNEQY